VRASALARVLDARPLAAIARAAGDPAVRLEALRRLADPALLADVACRSEHKDVASAAVERIEGIAALEEVAARAKNKNAAKRARARLEALLPKPEPAPPLDPAPASEPELVGSATPSADLPARAEDGEGAPEPVAALDEPAPALEARSASEPLPPGELALPVPVDDRDEASAGAAQAAERDRQQREALTRIQQACGRLEALAAAEALTLRNADQGLRAARAAHDDLEKLHPRATSAASKRLKAARAALFARAQELREADEWSRWGNATAQEELCKRMEALAGREDFEKVARELHEADIRWAQVKTAPRDEAEALRQRYQAARAQVKARVDSYFAQKAATAAENLKEKEALCARAEALAESTEWLKASDELKQLQALWKGIRAASHRDSEQVWKRFRAACDRFFTRRGDDLKRRKEEWAGNLARKEAFCVRAEALAASTDWEKGIAELRTLQAEWKSVGAVRKSRADDLWKRFRTAGDAFHDRYKRRDELEIVARKAEREAICRELEELLPAAGETRPAALEGLPEKVQKLQTQARLAPPLPRELEEALGRRFLEARQRLVEAYPGSFRGTELDPEANRARKEKLCVRVEALVAAESVLQAPLQGQELARRLKEALASNTIGGRAEAEARRKAEADEVEAAQSTWRRLGPVPGEAGAALEARFRSACDRFRDQRRAALRNP
jgi:hypothetical protein